MITTDIKKAKEALINGQLVAIPTETVYGLAGNAFSQIAVEKIFQLKKRPHHNPLIVHIKSAEYLSEIAREIPPMAQKLAHHFWPGPLTLVLKKHEKIQNLVTSGNDTVAVRIPNHQLTLELLQQLDFPLAAPSANPFGSISPTTAEHVYHYFKDELEVILDGGACEMGIESTIIGFENNQAILYRHGSLAIEEIEKIIGPIRYHTHNNETPKAPGMLTRHYAPKTKTYLTDDLTSLIAKFDGQKIGLLIFKNPVKSNHVVHQEILSSAGNYTEAASNLYGSMHHLDKLDLDVIIAQRLPDEHLGKTINDRLERATKNG